MPAQSEIMNKIGSFVVDLATQGVDDSVSHHAKRAVIDWFSALLPGVGQQPATGLMEALADEIGHGPCSIPGSGKRALPRAAALINGTASHIIEFDDIYRDGAYHPGCPTIAAVLAAAEARGLGGDAIVRGTVAGFEVSTRIAEAIQPAHYKYWHTTGTAGCFGAAAGAAAVLGLDKLQTMHAVSTVGTFAAALQQAFRSDAMSKPLHAGRAAEAGLLAALAAERGVTGALDILEGEVGFGAAMGNGRDFGKVFDDFGSRWNVGRITVKNHGCCGHNFPSIDGAQHLMRQHGFRTSDIARITLGCYGPTLEICGNPNPPRTPFEGKFSVRYTVAHALVYGSVRLDAYDPDHLTNPDVIRLFNLINVVQDDAAHAAFPKKRSAVVTIALKDGRELSYLQPTRKGDPDAPLTDDEISAKLIELGTPVLGGAGATALLERLWNLDQTKLPLAA